MIRAALLLTVVTLPAAAQSARPRLDGRVPPAAVPAVDSIIARAAADSLPTGPLEEKALEGGAKHVAPDRIVAAVAAEAALLRGARDLLRHAGVPAPSSGAEIPMVAAALARGLAPPVVERVVEGVRPGSPAHALHAVADLAAHGFEPDSAATVVLAASAAGLSGTRLLDVAAAAEQEVQRGRSRSDALTSVRARLPDIPAPPRPAPGAARNAIRPVHPGATPQR
ncbi:MAG TPA: hypothetical protein VI160_11915 [Gemmatimonadales bacterium]